MQCNAKQSFRRYNPQTQHNGSATNRNAATQRYKPQRNAAATQRGNATLQQRNATLQRWQRCKPLCRRHRAAARYPRRRGLGWGACGAEGVGGELERRDRVVLVEHRPDLEAHLPAAQRVSASADPAWDHSRLGAFPLRPESRKAPPACLVVRLCAYFSTHRGALSNHRGTVSTHRGTLSTHPVVRRVQVRATQVDDVQRGVDAERLGDRDGRLQMVSETNGLAPRLATSAPGLRSAVPLATTSERR